MGNKVERRLRNYWRLEAASVAFVPAIAIFLVYRAGGALFSAPLLLAMLACALPLIVGAIYWRAVWRGLLGDDANLRAWLPRLAAAEPLVLALIALGAIATTVDVLSAGGWTPARIAAAALTAFAALEYVNYYRVQLQHFDNAADFARLISGKGFRRAHLARDIAAWRARR